MQGSKEACHVLEQGWKGTRQLTFVEFVTRREKSNVLELLFKSILILKVLNATSGPSVLIRQNVYRRLTEICQDNRIWPTYVAG